MLGGAELAVQLGELVGVLGGAALGRGQEVGAEPIDNLGVLGCGPLLGGAGVAADPVEFGRSAQRFDPRCQTRTVPPSTVRTVPVVKVCVMQYR
ncbi:hypothetical protein [Pseudonocardia sp. T1-2H]|uniref:hypothetical protein n=1 Tax=Pseudonocardia sp. T1-2H TaxID=3128899 RepID=UPI00310145B8